MDYTDNNVYGSGLSYDDLARSASSYIDKHLKQSRRDHTYRVVSEAQKLSRLFGADIRRCTIASLLHDMTKNMSMEEMNECIKTHGLPKRYINAPNLAHSKTAAALMPEIFGINDREILNAVSYHTTGRENMSKVEKIVFLADAIEPGRDFPGIDIIRKESERNLDSACLMMLDRTIEYIKSKGDYLDPDTIKARDFLKKEGKILMSEPKEKVELIAEELNKAKGLDVTVIDISEKSAFADYFIIVSGGSDRQISALAERVEDLLEPKGIFPKNVEGKKSSGWLLMDYGDVVVNIMTPEMRNKYNIEKIWGDCEAILYN